MIAPDASVLIPGYVVEHRFHASAQAVVGEVREAGRLIAHTMAESYSVLSSPSGFYRVEPSAVVAYLDGLLGDSPPVQPHPDTYSEAVELLAGAGRGGGAIFDALIALAARDADAELVSFDRRAAGIYDLCGVEARLLSDCA
jgi:predicted nucleic acid-binding protein